MAVFDAITGNDDRHFYNWGILDSIKKTKKPPKFAPLYNSARGLFWNWSDENIATHLQHHYLSGKKIAKYIENAAPRISIDGSTSANHFELVAFIKKINPAFSALIAELAAEEKKGRVFKMLEKEFFPLFVHARSAGVQLVLKERFEKIRRL